MVEFGAGDGAPVLSALLKAPQFRGSIQGFELNPASAQLASSRAHQLGLSDRSVPCPRPAGRSTRAPRPPLCLPPLSGPGVAAPPRYQVANGCFFTGAAGSAADVLIANPPYIPAPDSNILMPALHGGTDGERAACLFPSRQPAPRPSVPAAVIISQLLVLRQHGWAGRARHSRPDLAQAPA